MLFVQLVQGRERCNGVAVRWHPRPDVVRRYVKLAWWWWEPNGQLHRPLDDIAEMPFDLVVRHVTIFGHGHGLQRAIIDESQHREPERLIMAQH